MIRTLLRAIEWLEQRFGFYLVFWTDPDESTGAEKIIDIGIVSHERFEAMNRPLTLAELEQRLGVEPEEVAA